MVGTVLDAQASSIHGHAAVAECAQQRIHLARRTDADRVTEGDLETAQAEQPGGGDGDLLGAGRASHGSPKHIDR